MATQNNIIDQVFPETLKILSDLIKFQTVSGTSNLKLIEYCEKKLNKLGAISFKTFHSSKQQANLFSTIYGKKKLDSGGIILSGHTDVVPASAKEWSSDPFVAREKNKKELKELNWDTSQWFMLFLNHFQLFETDELKLLFHLFQLLLK